MTLACWASWDMVTPSLDIGMTEPPFFLKTTGLFRGKYALFRESFCPQKKTCQSLRPSRAFPAFVCEMNFWRGTSYYRDLVMYTQCFPQHPYAKCNCRAHREELDTGCWNVILMFQSFIFAFLRFSQTLKIKTANLLSWKTSSYLKVEKAVWQTTMSALPVSAIINSLARVLTLQMFRHLTLDCPGVVWNQAGPWWKLKLALSVH